MQVQDVHFRLEHLSAAQIGRRAVSVNVSDIAAMGGAPRHVLTSIALPAGTATAWVEELYEGIAEEARRWGADVVGGNLTRIDGPICLDVVLLGSAPRSEVVLRSGGRRDDVLAVTGPLGSAAASRFAREVGLDLAGVAGSGWVEHADAVHPRVREGRTLAANHLAHAMLDLSDGLAGDLVHLSRASHTGGEIDARLLPIEPEMCAIAEALGLDSISLALSGGEDYELLVALDAADVARAEALGVALHVIGRLVMPEEGVSIVDAEAHRRPLQETAWRHFYSPSDLRKGPPTTSGCS
jgi:thiamine-monophosphate kinase